MISKQRALDLFELMLLLMEKGYSVEDLQDMVDEYETTSMDVRLAQKEARSRKLSIDNLKGKPIAQRKTNAEYMNYWAGVLKENPTDEKAKKAYTFHRQEVERLRSGNGSSEGSTATTVSDNASTKRGTFVIRGGKPDYRNHNGRR